MKNGELDKDLLNRSAMRILFEKLTLKYLGSHRWLSSPVVKNTALSQIIQNDKRVINFLVDKIEKMKIDFHPLKKIILTKDSKEREIYTQNWPDKIIQARVKEVIEDQLNKNLSPRVYSFQTGKGPIHAIESFLKFIKSQSDQTYILQLDISKYGENIDKEKLFQILNEKLSLNENPKTKTILKEIIYFQSDDAQSINKGLASGTPLVPLFENIYLSRFDFAQEQSTAKFYCRYGDDIIIAFNNELDLKRELIAIEKELKESCLELNKEKSKITKLDHNNCIEWLGYKINGKAETIQKEKHVKKICLEIKSEIHKHMHLLKTTRYNCNNYEGIKRGLEKLEERIYEKYLNRVFHFFTSETESKKIDKYRIEQTHKALCKNLKIDKRKGWEILRLIKHKSANQVRMKFLRKRQWPKVPLKN
jgi:hypothetical protein